MNNSPYDRPQAEAVLPDLRRDAPPAPTYYDRPVIKAPHWKWFIPGYFFVGGLAGGAALLGALARFAGGERHRSTVRHARYLALVGALLGSVLLILDLGRPKRFANMLRIVKVSSPLSIGTWILAGFGLTSGALAARQLGDDGLLPRPLARLTQLVPERLTSAVNGALGMGMGGYTGALLAATAVPLWSASGIILAPLFVAASLTSGASALVLLGLVTSPMRARRDLQAIETLGSLAQLGLIAAEERLVPESIGKPLRTGRWARLFLMGTVRGGLMAPIPIRLLARLSGGGFEVALSMLASVFSLLGTLAERFAIVEAGKESARDPQAYHALTAGRAGEARPTPQAGRSHDAQSYRSGIAARDTVTGETVGRWASVRKPS